MANKKYLNYYVMGCCVLVVGIVCKTAAIADNPATITPPIQADSIQGFQASLENESEAKQWGLTTEEFQQYQWLMNHTPSGQWYKTLDPAEVLALNTDDRKERMHYALIQAKNMHLRVSRELAFDKLYAVAYQTLYPTEKPIMSSVDKRPIGETLKPGDHVWLFLSIHTPLGRFVYQHLIKSIQATPNTVLDIYFVGDGVSANAIQAWAQASGVEPSMINQEVTLNEGEQENQRFDSVAQGKHPDLPFVGIVRDQQFQPISLSSVL